MNKEWEYYIKQLMFFLNSNRLLEGIYHGNLFHDEPFSYYYSMTIKDSKKYSNENNTIKIDSIYSGGISLFNKELALLKCLSEGVERLAQESFNPGKIIYDTYENNRDIALDPSCNLKNKQVQTELLGWIKGKNILTNKEYLIPAQYVHYSYHSYRKETLITQLISTGGATGWSHESTLLTGIYEVIERDAFMTAYYLKAPVNKIDWSLINNDRIKQISQQLSRYKLEWHLFDISNDLKIPVMASVLIDRTGYGPAVVVGASCGLNQIENIIKSVSEAIMVRPWIRAYFMTTDSELLKSQRLTKLIKTRIERALYWYPLRSIKNLSFWINRKSKKFIPFEYDCSNIKGELEYILNILSQKNDVYYCDISHSKMAEYGFRVYKVIIPDLHGLSLHESNLFHNFRRLTEVANHYKLRSYSVNSIPHPFL